MYDNNEVVRIRHPLLGQRFWLIENKFPSIRGEFTLYRIQMLNMDGTSHSHSRPITVQENMIAQTLGGYEEWKKRWNKD